MDGVFQETDKIKDIDMAITITSTAFKEGKMIPKKCTCDGTNVFPQLAWSGIPASARSIALICEDPDAPSGIWTHWIVFNMPSVTKEIPEGGGLPAGSKEGTNDFKRLDYRGPCPPSGTHRYYFKIYAVDMTLNLKEGATRADLLSAMQGHIIEQGQIMGTYKRS
jgi:Raf kinase inhibitor-like YbhB/YbcL family protein